MWKQLYISLKKNQQKNVKQYCIDFLNITNSPPIKPYEEFEKELNLNKNSELFPELNNTYNAIHNGDYNFIINYIYHFPQTNKDSIYLENIIFETEEELYNKIFLKEGFLLFDKLNFMPDFLLKTYNLDTIYTFLFIFFLPQNNKTTYLFHPRKKIPLLCCHGIADESFYMLYSMFLDLEPLELSQYAKNKNLNHLLIEDFMENCVELYSFKKNTVWDELLPIKKIYYLLERNYSFDNFEKYFSPNHRIIFETMPKILEKIEIKFKHLTLSNLLKEKEEKTETGKTKI